MTEENLKTILKTYKISRLDFMERRGSGIAKMFQAYKEDDKKPKIELFDDIFCVTFYSRLYSDETSEKHPKKSEKIRKI